jgi:hypothetical protein
MTKYVISEEEFDDFWNNVIQNNDPFDNKDITYYEHDYVKKTYIIKVKDV